jgi:hypothetical protein
MQESIQILMNENNKSFYPSDMFEFIHHLEYGCCDLKGLNMLRGNIIIVETRCVKCPLWKKLKN